MDGGRDRHLVDAGHEELEGDDLGQGVLKGDSVGIEIGVAPPALAIPGGRDDADG